jgi:outer membrane protein
MTVSIDRLSSDTTMTFVAVRGAPRRLDAPFIRAAVTVFTAATLLVGSVAPARAPQTTTGARAAATVRLSLDDALKIAQAQSQTVELARAGVARATGQQYQARSQYLPQLNATAGYTKTLESQFSGFASSSAPKTDTTKTQSSTGGFDLSKTSFGATNQWSGGLSFSQNVFAGGRISAQNQAAAAQVRSANIEVAAQRAQVSLDVTSAYYDAALADQLVTIADSSVAETEAVLAQTKVSKQVGNASEYELLRAQVTHDNQLPVAIQARANRQVAYLRLKQLLNMPLDDALSLTTGIEGANGPTLPAIAANVSTDTAVSSRAPMREVEETVRAQEAQVRVARAERIPSLAIVSNYQRLYFPSNVFPALSAGVNNWTVGVSTNFPILDGGRIKGDQLIAQAGLQQARAQREQTRQFAALDTRVALNSLEEAQATWDASRGTADQAQRAYAIDQVRYREGISTQTDLAQSRLLLEQALANRAQAARNLAVARVRLALLRDLPLQSGTGAASSTQGAAGAVQQQQQQQQQQQTQQQRSGSSPQAAGGTSGFTGSIQP